MRRHYLACLTLLVISSTVVAQNLVTSRRSSYLTHIYKINNDQAEKLYRSIWKADTTYLTHLFDTYPTDSAYKKKLPVGHYLIVRVQDDDVVYDLRSVNNLDLHLLNNHRDLLMVLSDSAGHEITEAVVHVRSAKVPFQRKVRAYRLPKSSQKGLVRVDHDGHASFFEIDRRINNTFFVRTARSVPRTFPINHLISPYFFVRDNIRRISYGSPLQPPGLYYLLTSPFRRKQLTGYMVFNKPEFRPGDTLFVKAFITTRKGRPVQRSLSAKLESYGYGVVPKKLSTPRPVGKGAYVLEVPLHDSLGLKLDQRYIIRFTEAKDRNVVSSSFHYAAYELKNNTFSARSEQRSKLHAPILYLKGEDSNNMPLFDVQVKILLRPKKIEKYYADRMFIPDTLWTHQLRLDPIGETRVSIPDSVLPAVQMSYEAQITFYNAERERTVKLVTLKHDAEPFPVVVTADAGKITLSWLDTTRIHHEPVTWIRRHQDVEVSKTVVNIPHEESIDRFANAYVVQVNDHRQAIATNEWAANLEILSQRTADSLIVFSQNPHAIPFHYFLFRNKKIIHRGEGVSLDLRLRTNSRDHYSVSIQYIWGGKPQTQEYQIPFERRALDIQVKHPDVVYPGQSVHFQVSVRDVRGKPVSNANLTAWAITKKFNSNQTPDLPAYGKIKPSRAIYNSFHKTEHFTRTVKRIAWTYWRKTLGLDSIAFYKFLRPDTGYYEYRMPVNAGSEIAPFVVGRGTVWTPQVIYVDNLPVYYRGTDTYEPYSFRVSPGEHTVAVRLSTGLVTVQKIRVEKNQKLIFSIDRYDLPSFASEVERPLAFTEEELKKLSRYFIGVRSSSWNTAPAYLVQGQTFRLLTEEGSYDNGARVRFAGPFYPGSMTYVEKSGTVVNVEFEPFHMYEFKSDLVKLREFDVAARLKRSFSWNADIPSFRARPMTIGDIQKLWEKSEEPWSFRKFPEENPVLKNAARLKLDNLPEEANELKLRAVFVINLLRPDEYYIFPKWEDFMLTSGRYEAVMIFSNQSYLRTGSFELRPSGLNYLRLKSMTLQQPDTFSVQILETIRKWSNEGSYILQERKRELQTVREKFYQESTAEYSFGHTISGQILSVEDGSPLPGVNVLVKGTTIGTTTDLNGYYRLDCPPDAVLVFSFIGLQTQEVSVGSRSSLDVTLFADVAQLSEVVVVGYGATTKRSMTASNSMLQGRVAGVAVRSPRYRHDLDSVNVQIRGLASARTEDKPLIILDGVLVNADEVDLSRVTTTEILNAASASALYGSRAANGVIILSTQTGVTRSALRESAKAALAIAAMEETPGNKLRKNFRDYAFWKPNLYTDSDGNAAFDVTFPDDITAWNANILGIGQKRSGQAGFVIRSYKPMLAQIALPHFMIHGDSASVIGKVTNYTQQDIRLDRTIKTDRGSVVHALAVKESHIDSIQVTTTTGDSLEVFYAIKYQQYEDGELRKIPVYKKGTWEATGQFLALTKDTVVTVALPDSGVVKLFAQADLIDVMMDEVRYLKFYRYACNEQLASRLRGLLLERDIRTFKKEKFNEDQMLQKTLRKLVANQNSDGSWSWWNTGEGNVWVTLHVARVLTQAEKHGFSVPIDKQAMINYLVLNLANLNSHFRLEIQLFLLEQGEKVMIQPLIDSIQKSATSTLHQKLLAQRLKQLAGESPDWSWIHSVKSKTIKGNSYWGEARFSVADNDVLNSLLVYKMLEQRDADDVELISIRNFLLEKRKQSWRNTYESSSILETLLPAMLRHPTASKPVLRLSGAVNQTIEQFPFEYTTSTSGDLTITKSGHAPVYFTTYQEKWNTQPTRSEKDFVVKTFFEDSTATLTKGRSVNLMVQVQVKHDAEYVMIEVPIPAGCSYASKTQSRVNGEVHREYDYHKTNIYSQFMKKGTYTFTISLLPRYSGQYTLNPAVAECMYFPVLFGREALKRVVIR
jgi:hypothetical protein